MAMHELVASADPIPVSTAMMSFIQKLIVDFLSSFIISFYDFKPPPCSPKGE